MYDPNYGEKLFVGNLPSDTTENELWGLFNMFGQVLEVVVLGPSRSKSGQSCAFVRFAEQNSAINAINHLDGRVPLRPHEDAALLLQVRPAKHNSTHSHIGGGSQSISKFAVPGATSSIDETGSCKKFPHESFQPQLPVEAVRLFVGNIPVGVVSDEVNELFRSVGVSLYENETFMMNGNRSSHNSICAFVVAKSVEDSRKAIEILSNKISLRPGSQHIKVKIANPANSSGSANGPSGKYENIFAPVSTSANNNYQKFYMPLYPPEMPANNESDYVDWKEPSIKTYHQYMMMPQSSHYGPLNIVPGSEPWRNNGIYSLPSSSYVSYMGL